MAGLQVAFDNDGRSSNLYQPNDLVTLFFSLPPAQVSNVKVQVIEASGPSDAVTGDRILATFSGQISGGVFKLDPADNGDPLNVNPTANPQSGTFNHSDRPPVVKIQFKGDSNVNSVPLPDMDEENGEYELKLSATGTGQQAFNGTAILHLRVVRDVMIVPDVNAATPAMKSNPKFSEFRDSAQFGKQWRQFAGARRSLVTVAINGALQDFENAVASASAKAQGGDIILLVGHGAAAGLRGSALTAFDTLPESVHGISNHVGSIDSDVLNLPNIANQAGPGNWVSKTPGTTDPNLNRLGVKYEMLQRIGAVMKQNGVARFIVVCCNMGRDRGFQANLANVLQTRVGGYDALVGVSQVDSSVLLFLMAGTDPSNDPNLPTTQNTNDPPFHEIPQGLRNFP